MILGLDVGICSDVGRVRDLNEDSCGFVGTLFVVADGMGGAKAGEVASAMAVQHLLTLEGEDSGFSDVLHTIVEANAAIHRKAREDESFTGMGTTVTVLKLVINRAFVAHVGDSRAYLARGGELRQLTSDHTLVAELVRNGGITEREALVHPQRHFLTRALGTEIQVDPEIIEIGTEPGDTFLLCTDGLSGMLSDGEIAKVLESGQMAQNIAEELVRRACEAGGSDNVSVIVVRV